MASVEAKGLVDDGHDYGKQVDQPVCNTGHDGNGEHYWFGEQELDGPEESCFDEGLSIRHVIWVVDLQGRVPSQCLERV